MLYTLNCIISCRTHTNMHLAIISFAYNFSFKVCSFPLFANFGNYAEDFVRIGYEEAGVIHFLKK